MNLKRNANAPNGSKGWWHRATQAQKLAQIDGGIECGMTARDVATCSGITGPQGGNTVLHYGAKYGRRFPTGPVRALRTVKRKVDMRRAYWQGDRDLSDAAIAHRNSSTDDDVSELVL